MPNISIQMAVQGIVARAESAAPCSMVYPKTLLFIRGCLAIHAAWFLLLLAHLLSISRVEKENGRDARDQCIALSGLLKRNAVLYCKLLPKQLLLRESSGILLLASSQSARTAAIVQFEPS
jgi:hypothetical protein